MRIWIQNRTFEDKIFFPSVLNQHLKSKIQLISNIFYLFSYKNGQKFTKKCTVKQFVKFLKIFTKFFRENFPIKLAI
jgi:hypothetical protein